MAFIKEEGEDMKIEEAFRVKHEDTEEQQTKMPFIKVESEDMRIEEAFRVKNEDTEEQTDACFLTLDPNTANTHLILSEDNRKVKRVEEKHPYPDHPDRFDVYQVLCRESVCGRCYWEIECRGECVDISVSYKSISRKGVGNECWFGYNDQSWSLICSRDSYSFIHNDIWTDLPVKPIRSSRIGEYGNIFRIRVYVDHSAGTLSFYSVSRNTMSLIHTEHTTFTQPLYPGFFVYPESSVKLC